MTNQPLLLTREGVSLVLAPSPSGVPWIVHWGAALPDLDDAALAALVEAQEPARPHSALDRPRFLGLLPENGTGFTGLPALGGLRLGDQVTAAGPMLTDWEWDAGGAAEVDARVRLSGTDGEQRWRADVDLELTREGLVRIRNTVTNTGATPLVLTEVRSSLPVPARADELLDLTGRWCHERAPQRRPWRIGTHLRQGRHGRTGHDATLLLVAGEEGFGFGRGEVWATHVAWSGDHESYAQRTPEGECLLGGGELLAPGEVVLAAGESYVAPWLLASYAGAGLDAMSARLHRWSRRHSLRSRSPRKVLVNTWEAVYFDHDRAALRELAERAAEVGVERFVLDDGWFLGRRDDNAGLGDWVVDEAIWPDGLTPLINDVHELGMEFGLWVEPEMVNLDSEVARAHPDWILRGHRDVPLEWRHQQVLDLQHPEAYAHVRDQLLAILDAHDIAYLKWDHNRDLVDAGHGGRPAVHGQTLAFYALLDELRAAHPGLEIESCASGGGRVDLEVLTRTERVWPSDTIDAVERQHLQRWTALLVPPEMIGAHLGAATAHTTGRTQALGFRAATALLGHFGIEWDLRRATDDERVQVRDWVALHKQVRPLLAEGTLVRVDHPDPALVVTGAVSADRSEAVFVVAAVEVVQTQHPAALLLPGLDPGRSYELRDVTPGPAQHRAYLGDAWLDRTGDEPVHLGGATLGTVGLRLPPLAPETARVLHLRCS